MATVSEYAGRGPARIAPHRRSLATNARRAAATAGRHAALLVCAFAFVLPFAWMLVTSIKTNQQILRYPPEWIPAPVRWENYADAMAAAPLLRYAANTTLICVLTVIGALLSNTVVAYGFSRLDWRGRDALFVVVLASLMLPFQVTMVPLFLLFSRIGWVNTYLPLIVPAFFGNAFYVFLLRQFFLGIPRDFTDAARLEGASELQILRDVVLPLARPALVSVALFQFLFSWNDYLGPLIFLNEQTKFTLALGLANMQSALGLSQFGLIMAAATLIVLPVLVIFAIAQRYFIEGIAASGLKG